MLCDACLRFTSVSMTFTRSTQVAANASFILFDPGGAGYFKWKKEDCFFTSFLIPHKYTLKTEACRLSSPFLIPFQIFPVMKSDVKLQEF